ncbi:ParA family protein [Salibacterium aidingense]|uniref:ParA family protein n=1 Tax=Salibacterium aidingense TaxID=384933 RepID=UPI003BD3D0F4
MEKGKVISFINMKGGVAKTTLTINIGNELAKQGNKVLIVDMDPQFNATQSLLLHRVRNLQEDSSENNENEAEAETIDQEIKSSQEYEKLSNEKQTVLQFFEPSNVSQPIDNPSLVQEIVQNLYLIPGDLTMAKQISGDTANKVGAVIEHFNKHNITYDYDFVLIDCPPTWSILTHSSLFASDYYIIPSKVDLYSSIGIELLEEQISEKILNDAVFNLTERDLKSLGIIFTLVHRSVKSEEDRMDLLKRNFPDKNFFNSNLPHMPSIPTKFVMFEEGRRNSVYNHLINAIEKITSELLGKL